MDPKEILHIMDLLSEERGITKEAVVLVIEQAIAGAVSKQLHRAHDEIEIKVDTDSGRYTIMAVSAKPGVKLDVDTTISSLPKDQLLYEEIREVPFDRVAVQTAKQLIMQKVREAERYQLVEEYRLKLGKLINGEVRHINKLGDVVVIVNERVETLLRQDDLLPQDKYQTGDEVYAVLDSVDPDKTSHQIFLSRTSEDMIKALFAREVPEVAQQIVEVRAVSRLPGIRCKVAVRPKDKRIDAMSACIGIQGKRVQAVQDELMGEKIDIVEWDDDPVVLVKNVLVNKSVSSVNINPATHTIDVAVPSEHIGAVLGRNGQNVRLAANLIGWQINVMEEREAEEKHEKDLQTLRDNFMKILDIEKDIAQDLVTEQFSSVQQLAYAPVERLLRIPGFDEDLIEELRNRARGYLLSNALETDNTKELMVLEGMTLNFAQSLVDNGIMDNRQLAEQSVDDLEDMLGSIDRDQAAEVILAARKVVDVSS